MQQIVDSDHLFVVFSLQSEQLHSVRPQESWKEIFDLQITRQPRYNRFSSIVGMNTFHGCVLDNLTRQCTRNS